MAHCPRAGRRIIGAVLSAAAASACQVSGNQADTSTVPVTPAPLEVPLYEQFESASAEGPNGTPINVLLGGARYPNSTGMWIGCRGLPATTTYRLARNYSRLTAQVGLQNHAPDGLAVDVTISGDGRNLREFSVGTTATVALELTVDHVDSLVVSAIAVSGVCAPGDTPYGALGDAVLTTNRD